MFGQSVSGSSRRERNIPIDVRGGYILRQKVTKNPGQRGRIQLREIRRGVQGKGELK